VLVGRPYTSAVEFTGRGSLQVRTSDFGAFCAQIATLTKENGISLRELLPTDESLESVFGYLIAGSGSGSGEGQGS
jgi:ABC-2 type transport system ATP-binding protein